MNSSIIQIGRSLKNQALMIEDYLMVSGSHFILMGQRQKHTLTMKE